MDVAAPTVFAIKGRLFKGFRPVGAAAIVRGPLRKRRQEIRVQNRRPGDALAPRRNYVYDTRSGSRRGKCAARICRIRIGESSTSPVIIRDRKATNCISAAEGSIQGRVGEVPSALQGCGDMSATHTFLDQTVPFLRYKEKDLVL